MYEYFRLQTSSCSVLRAAFVLGLFFDLEDRGDKLSSRTIEAGVVGPIRVTHFFFFLILRIVGGGVQTGSTRHRGHLLSYCACPGWLWGWRTIRWNEDWQGKPKYSEKTCPSATFSTTNPTWPDPGSNPGRRGGKPATNRLSYGAAKEWHILLNTGNLVRFEVFTAVTMKNVVFRDVAPCRSCVNRRFGGTYCLHLQGQRVS
jgi:hypothetical protein